MKQQKPSESKLWGVRMAFQPLWLRKEIHAWEFKHKSCLNYDFKNDPEAMPNIPKWMLPKR